MEKDRVIILSIMSYYARQIFNGTKLFEFRKRPLKADNLHKKIYIYSAKEDKAIIGCFQVSSILQGNTSEILRLTNYDKREDKNEIIAYFGSDNNKCFALKLENIEKFIKPLKLTELRKIDKNIRLPQYYSYIYSDNPLYDTITNHDKCYNETTNFKD